jgi:integrase
MVFSRRAERPQESGSRRTRTQGRFRPRAERLFDDEQKASLGNRAQGGQKTVGIVKSKRIPTGRVYRRSYIDRHGQRRHTDTYYVKYYLDGKPIVVATQTEDYDEAVAILRDKMAGVARVQSYSDRPERVRMNQLFDLVIDVGRMKGNASQDDVELIIKNRLRPRFGNMLAQQVTNQEIRNYVKERLAERKGTAETQVVRNFANATINKELSYIRRAFRLGASETPPLVVHVPRFEMLDTSNNVREGTLSHEDYRKVRDLLNPHGRIALVLAYHTGARAGELRWIQIDRIDFRANRINLPGFTTKNGKPRYLPIFGDMAVEIEVAISKGSPGCPFLIQCDGHQVSKSGWKKNWATACTTTGVPNALFHDLRRTALTNMIEAGFSEKEAMEISGHKTRYVFDRYHIVSARRLKEMASKLDTFIKAKDAALVAEDAAPKQKRAVN